MLNKSRQASKEHQDSDSWFTQNSQADSPRKINIAICIFLGIALGVSAASQLLDLALPVYRMVLAFLCFIAAGLFLSYLLLQKVVLPSLVKYSPKARLLWISICLLAGFFFVLTIPLMVYPKTQVVRITATGEKNAEAKSSEVWLNSIVSGDWAAPVHTKRCKGSWSLVSTALVSSAGSQPSELICRIRTDEDIYIVFGMHDWSGQVRLTYEDQLIRADLFSTEQGASKQIVFTVTNSRLDKIVWLILFIVDSVTIGFLLLAFLLWIASYPIFSAKARQDKVVRWYWFALVLFASWMLYLLVFWPGFVSPDSVFQFEQIATGQYTNWHPAFHTFVLGLTTRLWFSPAPAIILQIIILSGLMGWGLYLLASQGTPSWVVWLIAAFLAFSPGIALILLNPWKDVAYGIALAAMVLMIFYLISNEDVNASIGFWLTFGIVTSLVALFRLNGALVAFGTLFAVMAIDRRRWKSYLLSLTLGLIIFLGVTGPLYTMMNVNMNPERKGENLGPYYVVLYFIMAQDQAGTFFPPDDRTVLSEFALQDGSYSEKVVAQHKRDLLQMALAASLRNPSETIAFLQARSGYIFQILQPPRIRVEHVGGGIYTNPFGFVPNSKLPYLEPFLRKLDLLSESPLLDWLFWRNAFWMYLLIFAGVVVRIRLKTWKYLMVIIPVLLNALPLIAGSGGQISRYIFITLLMGPLFGIGLFFIQPAPSAQDQSEKLDLAGMDQTSS